VAFAVDYLVPAWIAEHTWTFVAGHLPDLAVVALPVLRPLRLLRLVALVRVLNRKATSSLHGRVDGYLARLRRPLSGYPQLTRNGRLVASVARSLL
jgi:voltage-gated potassium channel